MAVRDDFSTSLAFEPFLRPSEDGTVKLDFTASDKISTFVVSVFAHDKSMNNNVIRREMLVTLPVKVSVAQPQYLYEGDRYVLKASLSNNSGTDVQGVVRCASSVATDELEVTVPAGDDTGPHLDSAQIPGRHECHRSHDGNEGPHRKDREQRRVPHIHEFITLLAIHKNEACIPMW